MCVQQYIQLNGFSLIGAAVLCWIKSVLNEIKERRSTDKLEHHSTKYIDDDDVSYTHGNVLN